MVLENAKLGTNVKPETAVLRGQAILRRGQTDLLGAFARGLATVLDNMKPGTGKDECVHLRRGTGNVAALGILASGTGHFRNHELAKWPKRKSSQFANSASMLFPMLLELAWGPGRVAGDRQGWIVEDR